MGISLRRLGFAPATLARRLRRDGCVATWVWLRGQVWPCLTGVPMCRHSQVTGELLVGPQIGRAGRRYLERLGIRASINMRAEFDDAAHGLALDHHLWLPTVDEEAPSLEHLTEGVAFIHRVLASGERVYIHCLSGVGRAPTMAAAFLIAQGMELQAALAQLSCARPFIALTRPQMEQLRTFSSRFTPEADIIAEG
jgi:Dual specificity phosphatase, catalytic domain